jgi:transposase InsO family protein
VIVVLRIVLRLLTDLIALTAFAFRRRRATAAEILVLRRQIALYKERGIKPRRIDAVTRISLALLSRFFNWRDALVVVHPGTMIRWHRAGWKLFWRLKSRPGRPPIPRQIQALIRRMANENPAWGEQRIANEFLVKLGIRLSPRTVSKYLSESHLRCILKSWIPHYNTRRPHMALGPGVPDPPLTNLEHPRPNSCHRRGESYAVRVNPILGGLHHEYFLVPAYT